MRLWTLHPQYLDQKGLTACWREALLAQSVFGTDRGYSKHAQLARFTSNEQISYYLSVIQEEATARGYQFKTELIKPHRPPLICIPVTLGQVMLERFLIQSKLNLRSSAGRVTLPLLSQGPPVSHPLFSIRWDSFAPELWERAQVSDSEWKKPVTILRQPSISSEVP